MDNYVEQTVSREKTSGKQLLYVLSLLISSVLILAAMISAAFVLGETESGGLKISWLAAAMFVLFIAVAIIIWRFKDGLRLEYDYILQDSRLLVVAVLNNRRRVTKLDLEIGRILRCGSGTGPANPGVKAERYCPGSGIGTIYICFEEKDRRRMALLELNEDMIAALKNHRALQRGAWQGAEGKTV